MKSITSKVSYLSGLAEGLDIDKNTKEGKVLIEIINVLKDMANEVSKISETQKDMHDYIDAMDEDLASLQDDVYDNEFEAFEDEEDNFVEIKCSNCGDTVYIDKDILDKRENVTCPNCHNDVLLKK